MITIFSTSSCEQLALKLDYKIPSKILVWTSVWRVPFLHLCTLPANPNKAILTYRTLGSKIFSYTNIYWRQNNIKVIMWPNNGSPHNGALLFLILIFATIMDFGYALFSFTEGMHGGYCWRIEEVHLAWGRRCGIVDRGGAAIMIWGGWDAWRQRSWQFKG
jgi:hypothetical protein